MSAPERSVRGICVGVALWIAAAGCGSDEAGGIGTACGSDGDCRDGLLCLVTGGFADGYCTADCADDACPAGARCADVGGLRCLAECSEHGDCRGGYGCWRGTCRPDCSASSDCSPHAECVAGRCDGIECATDEQCGPGAKCDATRRCSTESGPPPTPDRTDGSPCLISAQCVSALCLPAELGGTCAATCTSFDSCRDAGLVCSPVPIDTDLDGVADAAPGTCREPNAGGALRGESCTDHPDCAAHACLDGQCTEPCATDADCLLGRTCAQVSFPETPDATFSGCGYVPRTADVELSTIDLGEQTVASSGLSDSMVVAMPADAVSFSLVARHASGDDLSTGVDSLVAPDGSALYSLVEISRYVDQPVRWLAWSDEAWMMLVPNSTPERVALMGGRHTLQYFAFTSEPAGTATIHLEALVKRAAPGASLSGTVHLSVYLVGVGPAAAAGPSDPWLTAIFDAAETILDQAGVRLETSFYDVDATAASRYALIDSYAERDSEMSVLTRLGGAGPVDSVDLFLVRAISDPVEGPLLGRSGGIPGPAHVHGTRHSGVVVAADPAVAGTEAEIGNTVAHELGHFLGLFHSAERRRPCARGESPDTTDCAPYGGEDALADTAWGDRDNLMYWASNGSADLSEGQAFVLVRSPLVR